MNPQIKQKWVSALRSGDYQQGRNYLRTDNGFCCLGVLCDLYIKENNVEWNLANNGQNYEFQNKESHLPSSVIEWNLANNGQNYKFQNKESHLPSSVIEWAGVEDHNPDINNGTETLAGLNDKGSTFEQIANLIEEQL
jgi:hypothetical protein